MDALWRPPPPLSQTQKLVLSACVALPAGLPGRNPLLNMVNVSGEVQAPELVASLRRSTVVSDGPATGLFCPGGARGGCLLMRC